MDSSSIREYFSIGPGLVLHWLSCFKVLHYDYLLLCRENAAWDMQWRYREKRNDQEHNEKASFFHLANFWMVFLFCFAFEKMSSPVPMFACYVICSCRKTFKQTFTGVLNNFAKNLRWSLFLIKFQDCRPAVLFKKRL